MTDATFRWRKTKPGFLIMTNLNKHRTSCQFKTWIDKDRPQGIPPFAASEGTLQSISWGGFEEENCV